MNAPRRPTGIDTTARLYGIVLTVLALVLLAVSLGVRSELMTHARAMAENTLGTLADSKDRELRHWLRDMRFNNAAPDDGTLASIADGRSPDDPSVSVEQRLAWVVRRSEEFRSAWLLGRDGNAVASLDGRPPPELATVLSAHPEARDNAQITDFYLDDQDRPALASVSPLRVTRGGQATTAGFLVVEIDPAYALYPMLERNARADPTFETFLARQEGSAVRYLNPLMAGPRALALRLNDPAPPLLALRTPDGERIVEGVDYRGVAVLGVVRHIPEPSWILVTKMDLDAVYAGAQAEFGRIALRLGALTALVALLLWLAIRHVQFQGNLRQLTSELEHAHLENQRQATAAALAHSEVRFRGFFELAMVGLAQMSPERRWMEVNPAMCEILGHDRETLLARDWSSLIHPNDIETEAAAFQDILANTRDDYHLLLRFNALGRTVWGSVAMRALRDAQGRVDYLVLIVEDITFLKERETQLRRALEEQVALNGRLEEARHQLLQSEKMASIGQLAAGVAHEINNPVGFVGSNIGTLGQYLVSLLAIARYADEHFGDDEGLQALMQARDFAFIRDDAPTLVEESMEGIARVRKIVQDLRDFSRVGESDWQWADVHRGLDNTLNIVWNEIKYKATLHKEYADLPQVYCLPSQLNQVFLNLLVNAAQSITGHGVITVRTGTDEGGVWIEVQDTGSGIAPEHLGRLFEPFFTTKPVGQGTGLGLSLAFSIVRKHGGRIDVDSEPGKGSRFRVSLPTHPPDATPRPHAASSQCEEHT